MEKIKLKPKIESISNPHGSPAFQLTKAKMISMNYDGDDIYSFSMDIGRIEEIIEWLYDNTTERFTFLGTENIYFESSEDAMAFKLKWS